MWDFNSTRLNRGLYTFGEFGLCTGIGRGLDSLHVEVIVLCGRGGGGGPHPQQRHPGHCHQPLLEEGKPPLLKCCIFLRIIISDDFKGTETRDLNCLKVVWMGWPDLLLHEKSLKLKTALGHL